MKIMEKAKAWEEESWWEDEEEDEGSWEEEEEENDEDVEDYKFFGYNSDEEFLEDFLGCDRNWTLEDFFDSYNN